MNILAYILILVFASQVISELLVLLYPLRKHLASNRDTPPVSILISVRNEEENIQQCLTSLLDQDYPDFEVLVANDNSTDSTAEIIGTFNSSRLKVINISEPHEVGINPKAENLEKLSALGGGLLFAIVDGDCIYPRDWLKNMVSYMDNFKLVSGATGIAGNRMEDLDWKINTGRIAILSNMGFNTSAVGNNMVVERKALESVGGWKAVKRHLTEDFALHRLFYRAGYLTSIIFSPETEISSQPTPFFKKFNQRKRWMKGVNDLQWITKFMVYLQSLILPFLIVGLIFYMGYTLYAFLAYLTLKIISNTRLLLRLREWPIHWLLLYQLYQLFFNFLFLLYQLFGPGVSWKGRKY